MNETPRSSLVNKTGRLVGFGFLKHPEKRNWWLHMVFYWVKPNKWVFCMGDTDNPKPEEMRPNLGDLVPGEMFAAYAQRCVEGADYAQFKKMIALGFPDDKFEWWEE